MPFPIDKKFIEETEKDLGISFPNLFKQKMLAENGGEVVVEDEDWWLYPFFDKSDRKRMSRTCNHIGLETKNARSWVNFPANAIAIGSNGSGDQLILLPEYAFVENLQEEIYIWEHETGNIVKVADSISDLPNLKS